MHRIIIAFNFEICSFSYLVIPLPCARHPCLNVKITNMCNNFEVNRIRALGTQEISANMDEVRNESILLSRDTKLILSFYINEYLFLYYILKRSE